MHTRSHETVQEFLACPCANIIIDDTYVVWFCYILGNYKALVSTNVNDGRYYEVTYGENRNECYIDEYVKTNQMVERPWEWSGEHGPTAKEVEQWKD